MWWFKSKHPTQVEQQQQEIAETAAVEVVAHKKATKEQIDKVKGINDNLNQVLEENGFTIKIFLAAGGDHSIKKKVENG